MLAAANVGKAYARTTCSRRPVRSANAAAHSSAPRLAAAPSTPTNTTSSRVMTFSPPLFGLCFTLLSYILGLMCTTSPRENGIRYRGSEIARPRREGDLLARGSGGGRMRARGQQKTGPKAGFLRSEEHTSELQSRGHLVCR